MAGSVEEVEEAVEARMMREGQSPLAPKMRRMSSAAGASFGVGRWAAIREKVLIDRPAASGWDKVFGLAKEEGGLFDSRNGEGDAGEEADGAKRLVQRLKSALARGRWATGYRAMLFLKPLLKASPMKRYAPEGRRAVANRRGSFQAAHKSSQKRRGSTNRGGATSVASDPLGAAAVDYLSDVTIPTDSTDTLSRPVDYLAADPLSCAVDLLAAPVDHLAAEPSPTEPTSSEGTAAPGIEVVEIEEEAEAGERPARTRDSQHGWQGSFHKDVRDGIFEKPEDLRARKNIRLQPDVQQQINKMWTAATLYLGRMTMASYVDFHLSIYHFIISQEEGGLPETIDFLDAWDAAMEDWITDTEEMLKQYGARTLHITSFSNSVFELIDLCTLPVHLPRLDHCESRITLCFTLLPRCHIVSHRSSLPLLSPCPPACAPRRHSDDQARAVRGLPQGSLQGYHKGGRGQACVAAPVAAAHGEESGGARQNGVQPPARGRWRGQNPRGVRGGG